MYLSTAIFVSFLISTKCLMNSPKDNKEIREMLSGVLKDYDVKLRPNYLGEPVKVTVDTTVLSISNIDEVGICLNPRTS